MTYKEKLRELLKTISEIKKDLEELKFGCEILTVGYLSDGKTISGYDKKIIISASNNFITYDKITEYGIYEDGEITNLKAFYEKIKSGWYKIIGNPLEERHLRMYLIFNGRYNFAIKNDGNFIKIGGNKDGSAFTICTLDNTKSFDNQNEEVYEKIFNYLIKEKGKLNNKG